MKFESSNSVNNLIDNAMEKLKFIMDSSTIIGESIKTESGMMIIPVSKVSVGYVVGGGEYSDQSTRRVSNKYPLAGGSGGGMSVTPVGFLVDNGGTLKFIDVENKSAYQTVMNLANVIIDKMKDKEEKKDEKDLF